MLGVSVELKISFDGNVPGLSQHRLSMSSFAEAFRLLSIAFQRTASFVLNDTLDPENAVRRGGRLEKDAKRFDLELKCVEVGSACPVFECIARAPSAKAGAVLHTEKPSLLWIRAEADLPEPNIDSSFAHILKNWSRTLEILAE